VLDPGNLLREWDETNNVAVSAKIPAARVHGLVCETHTPDQTCKCAVWGTCLGFVWFVRPMDQAKIVSVLCRLLGARVHMVWLIRPTDQAKLVIAALS